MKVSISADPSSAHTVFTFTVDDRLLFGEASPELQRLFWRIQWGHVEPVWAALRVLGHLYELKREQARADQSIAEVEIQVLDQFLSQPQLPPAA